MDVIHISKQETFVDISVTLWALRVYVVALLVNLPGKVLVKVSKCTLRCIFFELLKDVVIVALRKTVVIHSDSWWHCGKGNYQFLWASSVLLRQML